MKRPISLFMLIAFITLSILILLPLSSFSSDPVAPPFEGALITNTTNINVVGTFREDENFTHDQRDVSEITIAVDGTLIFQSSIGDQAETRYTDEVSSTDGHTTFVKGFSLTPTQEMETLI